MSDESTQRIPFYFLGVAGILGLVALVWGILLIIGDLMH